MLLLISNSEARRLGARILTTEQLFTENAKAYRAATLLEVGFRGREQFAEEFSISECLRQKGRLVIFGGWR